PVVLPGDVPVAVDAVCNQIAAVVPVLVLACPDAHRARHSGQLFVAVGERGGGCRYVDPLQVTDVIDFEAWRVRLNLQIRLPVTRLLIEHDAPSEAAERRAGWIVAQVRRVRTVVVVRGGCLGFVDRLRGPGY